MTEDLLAFASEDEPFDLAVIGAAESLGLGRDDWGVGVRHDLHTDRLFVVAQFGYEPRDGGEGDRGVYGSFRTVEGVFSGSLRPGGELLGASLPATLPRPAFELAVGSIAETLRGMLDHVLQRVEGSVICSTRGRRLSKGVERIWPETSPGLRDPYRTVDLASGTA